MKKNRLMRPSAAFFPLALAAAEWLTDEITSSLVLIIYFVLQLLSLCAVDAYRNAAAREPGPRKADRRFWASFEMLVVAMMIACVFYIATNDGDALGNILFAGVPWLVLIEQLFEERLFTLNRRSDGNLLALIANGLLFAGLMLDGSNGLPKPFESFYALLAAGLGALIAILASLVIAPPRGFSVIPRNLGFAPKAMVQALLYPAAVLALTLGVRSFDNSVYGFFAGFALWRLSRTVCRRSADESRPLSLLLVAVNALFIGAAGFIPSLIDPAVCCMTALVCAMIVFLRICRRNLIGTLLLAGALACVCLKIEYAAYIAIACGLIALIINLKNAFLKKV